MFTGASIIVIFKKGFRRYGLLRGAMAFTTNILIFIFSYFIILLVPLADIMSAEP